MSWSGETGQPAPAHAAHMAAIQRRDDGGMVAATPTPTPGLQPNVSTQAPQSQNMIQRFSAMSPEQLRELAPRLTGQMQQIAQHVLQQKQMQPQSSYTQPQQASPAIPQFGVPATQGAPPQQAFGGAVAGFAKGGTPQVHHPGADRDDCVPILAAGGEFVISPHHVARLGNGDVHAGHKALDAWVVNARKQIVEKMQRLKPPVKS